LEIATCYNTNRLSCNLAFQKLLGKSEACAVGLFWITPANVLEEDEEEEE
jgi:PAS domain-containing protein